MAIKFSNNATAKLVANVAAVDTVASITKEALAKFPILINDTDFFIVTLTSTHPTGKMEIVKVTGVNPDTGMCTIVRAQEGTTAAAFVIDDIFEHRLTAGSLEAFAMGGGGGGGAQSFVAPSTITGPSMVAIGTNASYVAKSKSFLLDVNIAKFYYKIDNKNIVGSFDGDVSAADVTGYTEIIATNNQCAFYKEIPLGTPVGKKYSVYVIAEDSLGNRSAVSTMTTTASTSFVVAPVITSPVANASVNYKNFTVTTSTFATQGISDTHIASQFMITSEGTGGTILADSGEVSTLRSHVFNLSGLPATTEWNVIARHKGALAGWSEWSTPIIVNLKEGGVLLATNACITTTTDPTGRTGYQAFGYATPNNTSIHDIIYFNGKYRGVSFYTNPSAVAVHTSEDLTSWNDTQILITNSAYHVYSRTWVAEFSVFDGVLYLSTGMYLYRSVDGDTWTAVRSNPPSYNTNNEMSRLLVTNTGIAVMEVQILNVSSNTPSVISTIYKSVDGLTWTEFWKDSSANGANVMSNADSTVAFPDGSFFFRCTYTYANSVLTLNVCAITPEGVAKRKTYSNPPDDFQDNHNLLGFMSEGKKLILSSNGKVHDISNMWSTTPPAVIPFVKNIGYIPRSRWCIFSDSGVKKYRLCTSGNNTVAESTDGLNWTTVGTAPSLRSSTLSYSYSPEGNVNLFSSDRYTHTSDFITWQGIEATPYTGSVLPPPSLLTGCRSKDYYYVMGATNNVIFRSTDGLNYLSTGIPCPTQTTNSTYVNGKRFFYGGTNSTPNVAGSGFFYVDGGTISARIHPAMAASPDSSFILKDITYGNGFYVCCFDAIRTSNPSGLYWSSNLVDWTQIPYSVGVQATLVRFCVYFKDRFYLFHGRVASPFSLYSTAFSGKTGPVSIDTAIPVLTTKIDYPMGSIVHKDEIYLFYNTDSMLYCIRGNGTTWQPTVTVGPSTNTGAPFIVDERLFFCTTKRTYCTEDGDTWIRVEDNTPSATHLFVTPIL